ncbi:MAG: SH3 domain-containing protein [Gemmataceae bacterium]|nr:SH3 domain-containing protein [Gemmataceae bacterium]
MWLRRTFLASMTSLVSALPVFAQTYPAKAPVVLAEVEVRSGPTKNFYPTSKLYRNQEVIVLSESKEAPGWLEIVPPAGSFSWINSKYVKQIDGRLGYVEADAGRPIPVLPGSTLVNQEPNRESMKLTAGTCVVIVDRPLKIQNETWLPIQPHPSERRYLPIEAVRAVQPVTPTTTTTPAWNLAPGGFAANNYIADAEEAIKNNDMNRARYLLQQIANHTTDQNQKQYALNRLATLPQTPMTAPIHTTSNPGDTRTALSPTNPVPGITNLVTLEAAKWSTYGRLRDLKITREDGQPIYALEDTQGRVLSYISNEPGKSLQMYLGRTVAVYGPTVYSANSAVRLQYMLASHVAVP